MAAGSLPDRGPVPRPDHAGSARSISSGGWRRRVRAGRSTPAGGPHRSEASGREGLRHPASTARRPARRAPAPGRSPRASRRRCDRDPCTARSTAMRRPRRSRTRRRTARHPMGSRRRNSLRRPPQRRRGRLRRCTASPRTRPCQRTRGSSPPARQDGRSVSSIRPLATFQASPAPPIGAIRAALGNLRRPILARQAASRFRKKRGTCRRQSSYAQETSGREAGGSRSTTPGPMPLHGSRRRDP